jgi:iron complex outermembrane recepter protein
MINPPDFMQGAGGSCPTTLPQLNAQAVLAFLKSLGGKPDPFNCAPAPAVCTGPCTPY